MKELSKILMLSFMVMPLLACQNNSGKSNQNSAIRYRAYRGAPELGYNGANPYANPGIPRAGQGYTNRPFSPRNSMSWGAIYGGSLLSEGEFNRNLLDFLAAGMDPSQVGTVSSQPDQNTGIRFWGYVEPSNGVFNPNGMGNSGIRAQSAELRIVIWDSYAGSIDASGDLITEIPVHIKGSAEGEINGNQARIRFTQPNVGWIEVYGSFDAQYFTGTVWFDNQRGYANYLGMFYINTCTFFRCN